MPGKLGGGLKYEELDTDWEESDVFGTPHPEVGAGWCQSTLSLPSSTKVTEVGGVGPP